MNDVCGLILAAGQGKRMNSKYAKVMHALKGKPIIDYCIEAAQGVTDDITVVVGSNREEIEDHLSGKVKLCIQENQLGTGDAVKSAVELLPDSGTVLVMPGDVPLIKQETIKRLLTYHRNGGYAVTMLSCIMRDPSGYGRIIRDSSGNVKSIVEDRDASSEIKLIKEINSAVYCFDAQCLKKSLNMIKNDNDQGEYYLTDTIAIIGDMGRTIGAFIGDACELSGINDRVQLSGLEKEINKEIVECWMRAGVTVIDPDTTYISAEAKFGRDIILKPGTIIEGSSVIADDAVIGPYTRIDSSSVGHGTSVTYSVMWDSSVGENCAVGPFAYLRPNSHVANKVKIGDFVELKNSSIGEGTKVPHLAYVGDADIGSGVNFSCGAITVNYDGKVKHRTKVGDRAFIGCNSNLVAPVEVEDRAFVAAGSTITDKLPKDALGIARSRQTNIEGWVTKKFKDQEV